MSKNLTSRQKERFTKMVEFLHKIPRKHFDLNEFVTCGHVDVKENLCNLKEIGKTFKTLSCGTAGCAVGWLPSIFPRSMKWIAKDESNIILLQYKDEEGWEAVNKFLGLTQAEAEYLFMPDSYHPSHRGPLSVAKRIERVIQNGFPKSYVDNYGYRIDIYPTQQEQDYESYF